MMENAVEAEARWEVAESGRKGRPEHGDERWRGGGIEPGNCQRHGRHCGVMAAVLEGRGGGMRRTWGPTAGLAGAGWRKWTELAATWGDGGGNGGCRRGLG
uniref:Uncharacterized protein n=1 Tax=Oryza sativa subsp. japonica TaxID=39947 RepID=Q6Z9N3_ORYSJ|nr:hypothetical protein [Oryza sativa Japonica Group]BAD12983.1 hypothetical protein [Oryza sativa Japonica Group]